MLRCHVAPPRAIPCLADRARRAYVGAMRIEFIKCHGSGNDFPLIDGRALALSEDQWPVLARALADRDGPVGGDGLLVLVAGDVAHGFGMRMFNSDGSEAETCLNGLRCVARLGFERLGLDAAAIRLKTSGAFAARVDDMAPGVATIQTRAGPAMIDPAAVGLIGPHGPVIEVSIDGLPNDRAFTAVAMPNPHLVTFVDSIDEAELVTLGMWCETGPELIPGRANVSFVEQWGMDTLYVRTFERGVGLTDSCGSAMAASTVAAGLTGRIPFGAAVRVLNRGGMVRASAEAPNEGGRVTIEGNATFEWSASIEVDLETGVTGPVLERIARADEVAAWATLRAAIGGGAPA